MSALLTKPLPGYGELFRMLSYAEIGPACLLSRAVGGLIGKMVILVMPGSRAAVELAMRKIILPELPHIVREAQAKTSACRFAVSFAFEQVEEPILVLLEDTKPVQLALQLVGACAVLLGLLKEPFDALLVVLTEAVCRRAPARPSLPPPASVARSPVAFAPATRRASDPCSWLARRAR